jgi:hypothetical protein
MAMVLAMFQQNRLNVLVMCQNPNEFRPAITPMPDDANALLQLCKYSP